MSCGGVVGPRGRPGRAVGRRAGRATSAGVGTTSRRCSNCTTATARRRYREAGFRWGTATSRSTSSGTTSLPPGNPPSHMARLQPGPPYRRASYAPGRPAQRDRHLPDRRDRRSVHGAYHNATRDLLRTGALCHSVTHISDGPAAPTRGLALPRQIGQRPRSSDVHPTCPTGSGRTGGAGGCGSFGARPAKTGSEAGQGRSLDPSVTITRPRTGRFAKPA